MGDILLTALGVLAAQAQFVGGSGALLGWRLGHAGVVGVVVLDVGGFHLVDGQDGQRVLQPPVGDPAVQQGLHHHGVGDNGDVVGNPGLH